jgi:transmembrane sensor
MSLIVMSDESYDGQTASYEGISYDMLRRYISGASSDDERRRVETWAAMSAERRAYLAALARTWQAAQAATSDIDHQETDSAWAELSAKLDVPADASPAFVAPWEGPSVEIDVSRRRPARVMTGIFAPRPRQRTLQFAAAASFIIIASATLLWQRDRQQSVAEQPAPMREVATTAGQRAEITLGDGSTVTLGVKSRLRFPADFGARRRELQLEGEAYFVVKHDSTRPFTVIAEGSRTVDVGTAFVLRAYPGDNHVQLVVTEGEVAMGRDGAGAPKAVALTKGYMGRLAKSEAAPTVSQVDTSLYTAWLRGRLAFDNTPLGEVASVLERWYGVDVRLADPSLARETLTASFSYESLSEALATVNTVLNLRAERAGNVVTLSRRRR